MNNEPLVSVAMCTYNGEKYIRQQLDSILNQTWRNLEVVIVDDRSTDDTFSIISDYAEKDSRISCFKNEVNLGFNKNFERAIGLTIGDYVAISDQDDIWLPNKIERLMESIGDNWLIFSNSSYINQNSEVKQGEILTRFNPGEHDYKGMLLANFITGHTTLFKREFISHLLPFPQEGFYDWWIGFAALYHQKIIFIDEPLTQYRIHDDSVIQERINSGQAKAQENNTIAEMLDAFVTYKYLNSSDKKFISNLKRAYQQNLTGKSSIPLLKMVYQHYNELFPYHKNRQGLSRFNFARKYTRKVKNAG